MDGERDGEGRGAFAAGGPIAQRVQALGHGDADAQAIGRRVQADIASMIARFGLDAELSRGQATLERLVAETRCASCGELERCHRFLDGAADEPKEFCPNAGMFGEIAGER